MQKLTDKLRIAERQLINLVSQLCWNTISNTIKYIVSEIDPTPTIGFSELHRRQRRKLNSRAYQSIELLPPHLMDALEHAYDINLQILRTNKQSTIIDIRYFTKENAGYDEHPVIRTDLPMIHSKVCNPPYSRSSDAKFDVNWELGGLRHKWNMYWWKRKRRKEDQT